MQTAHSIGSKADPSRGSESRASNTAPVHPITQHSIHELAELPPSAVSPYTIGSLDFTLSDFLPLHSQASGYTQKWEFYAYTQPYQVRLKFEISNFAFSKNEGKVKGYVRKVDGETTLEEYPIDATFPAGQWSSLPNQLDLRFGNYRLRYESGRFYLSGTFERGQFQYAIPIHPWKPDTGSIYFGNTPNDVFKYSVLTYHQNVLDGSITFDGDTMPLSGQVYANHYATTVAVYDMFDEVSDFRMRDDQHLVEFRYYVPSQRYDATPLGFLFVAANGQPLFESTQITRTPLERWSDDAHYGYEIDVRQQIDAQDRDHSATFTMRSATPHPSDPYQGLSAFKRNVASRFAKPMEYSIEIDWELLLKIDGFQAKIPYSNTYTITRLR